MIDDETFFAWLDGELDAQRAAEVEVLVAADPDLLRKAEAHRAVAGSVRAAFDPIAEAPVPVRLLQAVQADRFEVVDVASAPRRRWLNPFPAGLQWAAMATTLAIGMVAGTLLRPDGDNPLLVQGGKVLAAASLDQALETGLASAEAQGDVRIGVTFRDRSGRICRSFTGGAGTGLACRRDGDWQVRGLFQVPEGQDGEFRMASGQDPQLAELIQSTMAGEPFDAAAERQARDQGWR
jgi:hypothetical protein